MSKDSPPHRRVDSLTADELQRFADSIRAECDAALAKLDTVDRDELSPELRNWYDTVRSGWEQLRALTDPEALALQELASLYADRQLTTEELRGLASRN